MQTRLHPADSRIRRLSAEIPAQFVVFDVLLWDGEPVWKLPLEERRARVESLPDAFRLSPCASDVAEARGWLDRFEAIGLDGVVAKRRGLPYLPGSRDGVVKVKEHKTADCVVVGVRWKGGREKIATLLLGLYRDDGGLDYVGSSAVGAKAERDVAERVLPLLEDAPDRRFSEPNRWGTGELEETAIWPELVVEVRYDKVQGDRFRHGTKFLRWRPDKDPKHCTWRELRPPRDPDAPSVDALLGS
jgi:ATP-dependent DNA ligase